MNTKEVLTQAGLTEKESLVYLALVELGETSVAAVAKKAGLKRPSVYVHLTDLEEKDLVHQVARGKKTFYVAAHPKTLQTHAEIQLQNIRGALPQMEALFEKEKGKPRVLIFNDKDKLDQALNEAFVATGECIAMGSSTAIDLFPQTIEKIEKLKTTKPLVTRELMERSEKSMEYKKLIEGPSRKLRFIPKELLPFNTDIVVFGEKTLITSVEQEYFTISIESKDIAQSFKTLFEVMWKLSEE